ncbi:putative alanine--tRNA ligase [Helianthus annuus]|nr:putative alanine--tRNA ligase [Helianthus annuus]KAJ0608931.1 putative alanine--tRNA ligase [Helianthus annuus]
MDHPPTTLLYHEDMFNLQSTATLLSSFLGDDGRHVLILDSTVFHPQGGGQPSDTGFITDVSLLDSTLLFKMFDPETASFIIMVFLRSLLRILREVFKLCYQLMNLNGSFILASNSIREETGDKLERLGSKLATNSKDQGGKWLFLNYWSKTVKMTKPQGAKRKFTLRVNMFNNIISFNSVVTKTT